LEGLGGYQQAKPGSIYSCSNMGYSLLVMIIESVTNQRYEKYLSENILKSLEMYKSTFQFCNSK
jgi:CubicO group peptidase (beta-lactamase class C family)